MPALDAKGISDIVYEFVANRTNPALFAGVGVRERAGLPTWPQYVGHLAAVAAKYDPDSGRLIHKRAKLGDYLSALVVYESCHQIPPDEMYKQLAIPFCSPSYDKLLALVSLPFCAMITTNHDRSLHDAFAKVVGRSPMTVELEDPTMQKAPFLTDFYIARIHGRAEVPETILLVQDDYRRIEEDACYVDFLLHVLTKYSCIFLGFSFLDPAISSILRTIEARFFPGLSNLHLAILPADADAKFKAQLARFHIDTVEYDTSENHAALWQGITLATRQFAQSKKIEKPKASFPLTDVRRFLATSYARAKLESELQPLRDIAVDALCANISWTTLLWKLV
jgi:hypothetical protein